MKRAKYIFLGTILALVSCGDRVAKDSSIQQPEIFPDYKAVTIPRTIAPLDFSVPGATHMQAQISAYGTEQSINASGDDHIEIDIDRWHEMIATADSISVTVSVWGKE